MKYLVQGESGMSAGKGILVLLRRWAGAAAVGAGLGLLAISAAGAAYGQAKSAETSQVVRLNRAPVNKEVLRVKLPRPEEVKLANGLTVLLLENHKLPTVAFTMWIRPGQLDDPANLPGLASFTAQMLTEGTARRSSAQIASETDSLGATLDAESDFGDSYSVVSATGLNDSIPQILDLLSDVVLHPAFPAGEFAKFKQRELASLEEDRGSPRFLGNQALHRVLYGDFAAAITAPTKESINQVTVEDLKKFHDQHYVPSNTVLGVTGDFQAAAMRALIEKYFGGWSGAPETAPAYEQAATTEPAKITLVDRPGSVQTYILAGDRAIRRSDPEYYTLVVMNQVLGGGPQSRLFLDLREVHGFTYGAYSGIHSELYPGDWYALAPVRTPVTGPSMERFVYEFKKINDEAVPQGELEESERAIVARFALSLEQPSQILDSWLTVQHFGLPMDYWDKYADNISAVRAPAVQSAAKRFVDLDHMQWICVGDRKQIQSALEKYGPVSVEDAEGKPEK
jgi:zinc protease